MNPVGGIQNQKQYPALISSRRNFPIVTSKVVAISQSRSSGQMRDWKSRLPELYPWVVATKVEVKWVMLGVGEMGYPWHRVCPVAL